MQYTESVVPITAVAVYPQRLPLTLGGPARASVFTCLCSASHVASDLTCSQISVNSVLVSSIDGGSALELCAFASVQKVSWCSHPCAAGCCCAHVEACLEHHVVLVVLIAHLLRG